MKLLFKPTCWLGIYKQKSSTKCYLSLFVNKYWLSTCYTPVAEHVLEPNRKVLCHSVSVQVKGLFSLWTEKIKVKFSYSQFCQRCFQENHPVNNICIIQFSKLKAVLLNGFELIIFKYYQVLIFLDIKVFILSINS